MLIIGKVLISRKSAYFGKWKISHLRYSLYGIDYTVKTLILAFEFLFFERRRRNGHSWINSRSEDQKLPKKPQLQSCITQIFKNNKSLNVEKNTGYLFFQNLPLPQISIFSSGCKGCAYYGKSAYYE